MKVRDPYLRIIATFIVAHIAVSFFARLQYDADKQAKSFEANDGQLVKIGELAEDITMILKMQKVDTGREKSEIGQGPHAVELRVRNSKCASPRFWVRLVGDALVQIPLQEEANSASWRGNFFLPIPGSYSVDARWYGCSDDQTTWKSLESTVELSSSFNQSSVDLGSQSGDSSLFSDSAWISSRTLGESKDGLPSHIWKKRLKHDSLSTYTRVDVADTSVLVEGTVRQPGRLEKYFGDLGNYELLCFMGSQSAFDLRRIFLELRPHVSPSQRPFKFHYYNVTNLLHPDQQWTLDHKQRVRKCKHILLSIDELQTTMSQSEFKEQLKTFVGHLLKVMDDETFPIRILTVSEPPMLATNCRPMAKRKRTTEHPCNQAIKGLFEPKTFPDRVILFDNTDLSNAQFGQNRNDILAVIALRVFVVVGEQVAQWRTAGQKGMIDGLHRNGIIEPNFELLPYEGWS